MGAHLMERETEEMKIKISLLLSIFVIFLLPLHVFAECIEGNCTDGKGTMIYPQVPGRKYAGQFKNSNRDGKGTFIYSDGTTSGHLKQYEGEWEEDKPSGKGSLTFFDGRIFVGDLKSETAVTKGSATYGGREMPATYRKVVISAQGTMFYPDGSKKVGEFKDDKFYKK